MNTKTALGRVEVCIFIFVLGFLLLTLVPLLAFGRDTANRALCADNLRQIGMAAHLYAQENEGKLPENNHGNWAWDVSIKALLAFIQTGAVELDTFFCPAAPEELLQEVDLAMAILEDPQNIEGGYLITSYILFLQGTPQIESRYMNESIGTPPPFRLGRAMVQLTESQKELAVDVVVGTAPSFTVTGGATTPYRPNHMAGDFPAGGNVLYLDGHVEWRQFADMRVRTSGPPFWW